MPLRKSPKIKERLSSFHHPLSIKRIESAGSKSASPYSNSNKLSKSISTPEIYKHLHQEKKAKAEKKKNKHNKKFYTPSNSDGPLIKSNSGLIATPGGFRSWNQFTSSLGDNQQYFIPAIWPTPIKQKGHCCGLYALEISLRYAYPDAKIPPARKNGAIGQKSLRQVAKENRYSSFGEIFNVNHLQSLAEDFGFKGHHGFNFDGDTLSAYLEKICGLIKEGNSLILSCDLNKDSHMPGSSEGLATHWALAFGYIYLQNKCHLMITQYGAYYLWDASKLYYSNQQLPKENPRSGPKYVYYKNPSTREELYINRDESKLPESAFSTTRSCLDDTLEKFRFSIFTTPTPAMKIPLRIPQINSQSCSTLQEAKVHAKK